MALYATAKTLSKRHSKRAPTFDDVFAPWNQPGFDHSKYGAPSSKAPPKGKNPLDYRASPYGSGSGYSSKGKTYGKSGSSSKGGPGGRGAVPLPPNYYSTIGKTKKEKKKGNKKTKAKFTAGGAIGGAALANMVGGEGDGSVTLNQSFSMQQGGGYDSGAQDVYADTYVEAAPPTYDSQAMVKKGAGLVGGAFEDSLISNLTGIKRSIPHHARVLTPKYIPKKFW